MRALTICSAAGCGRLVPKGRCPEHAAELGQRKLGKARRSGYSTAHWRNLSALARELHPYCACGCGRTGNLTVHLRPDYHGLHRFATLDDVLVLARSCHGAVDGRRAAHR